MIYGCLEFSERRIRIMKRTRPTARVRPQRSRENVKREVSANQPLTADCAALFARASYGPYSKHKYHPHAYGLLPYTGGDAERTYCDEHAGFGLADRTRVPTLLERGIHLGLWSERIVDDVPALLWTIDDNGWIYELRITNSVQAEYHGYPVLPGDAFAQVILAHARQIAFTVGAYTVKTDLNVQSAITAAESFYS